MQTHALAPLRLRPIDLRPLGFRSTAGPAQPGLLRRARLVALAAGGFLLPWSALLAVTLPATAQAQHWAMAWTGLDAAEAAAALATAFFY